ncbi:unnamed protein product [Cochlearia groenlandica]
MEMDCDPSYYPRSGAKYDEDGMFQEVDDEMKKIVSGEETLCPMKAFWDSEIPSRELPSLGKGFPNPILGYQYN